MRRAAIEKTVVFLEWQMFQKVQGINGRAACQDNMETFVIMRTSQFESWDMEVVESYLKDLQDARNNGRNLMVEKYAYMMEETDPEYFASIRHILPTISEKKKIMVEKILVHYREWVQEFAIHYPNIRKNGRQADMTDLTGRASLFNYLKCELYTYSERTLELYCGSIIQQPELNRYWLSMEKMAEAYGYKTLDEAEEALK